MKKLSLVALASSVALATAMPANAAITASLPVDAEIWSMSIDDGDMNLLNINDGSLTEEFDSSITSDSWIVGADYDPATDSVYWIKNFDSGDQALVRLELATGDETTFLTEGETLDIRGIDITGGIVRIAGRSFENNDDIVGVVTFDEDLLTGTVAAGDETTFDIQDQLSSVAIDPTDGTLYVLTYDCVLSTVDDAGQVTEVADLDTDHSVSPDCVALDFDSNGRAWMTSNYTGRLTTFVPSDIDGTLEESSWSLGDPSVNGEAIFIHGAEVLPVDDSLASTGFDASGVTLFAVALLGAGAVVVARRRKS